MQSSPATEALAQGPVWLNGASPPALTTARHADCSNVSFRFREKKNVIVAEDLKAS